MSPRQFLLAVIWLGVAGCEGSEISLQPVGQVPLVSVEADQAVEAGQQVAPIAGAGTEKPTPGISVTTNAVLQQVHTPGAPDVPNIDVEQLSMQQFARSSFAGSASGDPVAIESFDFVQDAEHDDFMDLLDEDPQLDWE